MKKLIILLVFVSGVALGQTTKSKLLVYDPWQTKGYGTQIAWPKTPDSTRNRKGKELVELRKEIVKTDSILSVINYLLEKSYALDSLLGKPHKKTQKAN